MSRPDLDLAELWACRLVRCQQLAGLGKPSLWHEHLAPPAAERLRSEVGLAMATRDPVHAQKTADRLGFTL
jgi:hypothetical protein